MPYRITGTLKLPSGVVAAGVDLKFTALKSYSPLIEQAEISVRTDAAGKYDVNLEFNSYVCEVTFSSNRPFNAGQFTVAADTVAGQDLPTLLNAGGWSPATPAWIIQIQTWMKQASAAAADADASAKAAKASETNSKASETAVEFDRADVASKTADVTTKHANVVAKASQVATDASAAQAAKTTAVQAADTASQKAASAATHDASAQDAATRAENAASAVTGAVLDGGECNLSGGVYPQPLTVAGNKYSTIWYVAVAGTVSGTVYDVGDILRYTTAKTGYYFKVDAKDDVYSVNGEKGAVVVTPQKIGAEVQGAAQSLVDQHAAKLSAHSILGIAGLRDELNSKTGLVWSGQVPIFGQWLFPYHLRFMSYAQLWSAVNKLVANPGPINLASLGKHRFSVVAYVDAPSVLIYRHAYYITLNGGVDYQQTNSEYSVGVPHTFIGHTNSNQAQVKMQGVKTTENNGFPYWELVFPTGLNVQAAQDLQIQLRICVEKTWA